MFEAFVPNSSFASLEIEVVSPKRIVRQILSRANLEAAAANQVKGKVENVLEQKTRVSL